MSFFQSFLKYPDFDAYNYDFQPNLSKKEGNKKLLVLSSYRSKI